MRHCHLLLALACWTQLTYASETTTQLTQVVKATCRLQGEGSSATCFIVSLPGAPGQDKPRLLLATAAHVLEKMKGDEANLVLRRWDDQAAEYVRVPRQLVIREEGKPLWTRHAKHDVAMLELPSWNDLTIDALPQGMLATDEDFQRLEPGQLVRCVGYPHAAQFDPSKPGFPLMRLGCLASFPLFPVSKQPAFLVDFNTFEGDSGGPVVVELKSAPSGESRFKVIGVIHGQHFLDERYNLVYQKGHIRKRLGLSIVVNSEAILETLGQHSQR